MKTFIQKRGLGFFVIAVILLWLKTYSAYLIEFKLGISNVLQHILLFVNPISSSLFFLGFALLFKKKWHSAAIIVIHFFMSFLLYANIVYYRFFNDFITLPTVMQAGTNGGQLGDSAFSLMRWTDMFYFMDTIILIVLAVRMKKKQQTSTATVPVQKSKSFRLVLVSSVVIFVMNLVAAEIDRPELLSRAFDRNYLVKYLGAYNFTVFDAIQNVKSNSQRALANSNDVTDVENYLKANSADPNPAYYGKAKGMNVITISLESLQNFVIDYKVNGKEVTPFLNSLAHDNKTFYFDNFFHQTGQGKTSDAEFMMDTGLFPLSQGSVFINKAQNTYQALPGILKKDQYTSAEFHGNTKTFWNRNEMFKSFGYDRFYDSEYYDMNEQDTKNYGLKDKPFFKESMPMLENLKQPFYSKFITLSNHFPFGMDEGDTDFEPGDFGDSVVNNYFQSAHYLDEAIEQFFNDLKKSGLYDNTVVIMYGDHYGISENHNEAMEKVTGQKIGDYENAQLMRVPLFIHVPGVKGGQIHKYSGEVDVAPTLLHLLGDDTKNYLMSGSDILSKNFKELVPFRNGDFVSKDYTKVGNNYYSNKTGEKIEPTDKASQENETVKKMLETSDKIVTEDLLRFYKPKGFTPIDRNQYDYTKKVQDEEDSSSAKDKSGTSSK
ncbi:LTA synthase family protein [Bacillus pumilus]|uniref:LTA synthase family protein n=1 Tax=Bacillus pumilus TaxID=1408 RepID=UPI0031F56771